ncbi:hypothetical protein HAX54_025897 [Datura stramonium]|uniref:Putative plant transposon protein domain-containing protein n=1 Tax=Datura stramonium TaxID=4076 RepID=A0ABS8V2C2_DATST|nr:hypothetical protein [Datura stramonium]
MAPQPLRRYVLGWVMEQEVPKKHVTQVNRERVCLVYVLMTGIPINVGVIIKTVLKRARVKKGQNFGFGGLLTQFLRGHDIEGEEVDYRPAYDPRGIDVTKTNMQMLQLRMNGVTEEQLQQLKMDYPLSEHSRALCNVGPGFEEPLDDYVATEDEMARIDS